VIDTDNQSATTENARALYSFFISFVAALGGFLFGYDLVIISGAQIFLRDEFALSPTQFGFAVSSALLGCIAGPSLGAWLCDTIGRKSTLVGAGVLFAIGAVGTALATSITAFNIFRIGGGIGVGLSSLASPMYIAESAPARSRGRLGLMYQLAIVVGALGATIVSYFLAKYVRPTVSWRLMFASVLFPVGAFILLLIKVPQAPRWLVEKGRDDEALQILSRINGTAEGKRELKEIKHSLAGETGTLAEFLKPGMLRALFVGGVLALLGQWTGWSGIAYYLPTLFQQAGYTQASAAIGAYVWVMTGVAILTVISIYLVDWVGRKPLWLLTSAAMFLCLIAAGWIFQIGIKGPMAVTALFFCAAPHAVGLGPLPWLMMSELYPTRIRARAVSFTTTLAWIAGFSGPFAFPMIEAISRRLVGTVAGLFWFYAVVCVISFFWALRFLPETKGRSLEEIARSWNIARRPLIPQ
jgi:MFS transporter, SP family, arabinose:H+ symporter